MNSNFLEKESCSIHNESCVAVCVAQQADAENLLLCIKCMADQLSLNKSVLLNNEAVTILGEIKQKEYDTQKSQIEQSLDKYRTSIQKIQDYMDWQNGCLNKIIIQLNSEIENIQNELDQIKEPKTNDLIKSDVQILHQNLTEKDSSNIQQIIDKNQEKTKEFLVQVEKQLQGLKSEDNYQSERSERELISKKIENQFDSKRTPFLQHECTKHGQEIIMFTLEENYEGDRSLFVECFPEFRYKVTTSKEAEKLWMIHQSQVYNSQSAFISQREQKLQQVKDINDNYQQVYQNKQDELLKLIDNKNKQIEKEISKLHLTKNQNSLLSLELKDLQNVLNQLSQKDQMSQIKAVQIKLKNDDQKFHQEIFFKLSEIEQLQKDSKQEQLKLFDSNDYFLYNKNQQLGEIKQKVKLIRLRFRHHQICIFASIYMDKMRQNQFESNKFNIIIHKNCLKQSISLILNYNKKKVLNNKYLKQLNNQGLVNSFCILKNQLKICNKKRSKLFELLKFVNINEEKDKNFEKMEGYLGSVNVVDTWNRKMSQLINETVHHLQSS